MNLTPSNLSPRLRPALHLAAAFALAKLLLHFALTLYTSHIGYGYFRDEFYFLMCGRRLAWGYVDQGPVVAVMARSGELLFGDSVFAIRIFPAVAGALSVGLTGLLTWALGGQRSAQALAMLGCSLIPVFLGVDGYLSMNCLEPLFWMGCLLLLLLKQQGAPANRLWPLIGLLAGVGLLNKPSMLFFLAAMLAALLISPQRTLLLSPYFLLAVGITLLCVSPFLLWQIRNHWPTWEFLRNGQLAGKNVVLSPITFLLAQINQMQPVMLLLWGTGLFALFRAPYLRPFRWIGTTYVLFFALMLALHAKDYYLAPVYPVLFAAGSVFWEHRLLRRKPAAAERLFPFFVLEPLLVLTSLLVLPMASPILRPLTWSRYTHALHLTPGNTETAPTGIVPQFFADRFGWTELTTLVVNGYRSLTPEEQRQACIFASNYGEAGALQLLGPRLEPHLPPVISGHNNYWLWGRQGCSGEVILAVVPDTADQLRSKYRQVTDLGVIGNSFAMPYERRRHVYLMQGRRPEAPIRWEDEKHYD